MYLTANTKLEPPFKPSSVHSSVKLLDDSNGKLFDGLSDKSCEPLLIWLNKEGINTSACIISNVEKKQRGVFANRNIKKGECIIHIPLTAMFTLQGAFEGTAFKQYFDKNVPYLGDQHALALALCLEQRKKSSPWQAYLHSLPKIVSNMPLFFGIEKLHGLRASAVMDMILKRRFRLEQDYGSLPTDLIEGELISLPEYIRARTWVQSRSMSFKCHDKSHLAMIPLVDLFNHDGKSNASWGEDQQGFSVWARDDIKQGDEITAYYGKKSTQRYYAHYGFLSDSTQDDEVRIEFSLKNDDPHIQTKMDCLKINQPTLTVKLTRDINETLTKILPLLRILTLSENNINEVDALLAGGKLDVSGEREVLQLLRSALSKRLSDYQSRFEIRAIDQRAYELLCREHAILEHYLCCLKQDDSDKVDADTLPRQIENTVRLMLMQPSQWPEFLSLEVYRWQQEHVPDAQSLLEGSLFNEKAKKYQLYGIHYDDRIVGAVSLMAQSTELWLGGFHLDKDWQLLGIGGMVMDEIIKHVINHGTLNTLSLDVEESNLAARRFYESRGLRVNRCYNVNRKLFWLMSATSEQLQQKSIS